MPSLIPNCRIAPYAIFIPHPASFSGEKFILVNVMPSHRTAFLPIDDDVMAEFSTPPSASRRVKTRRVHYFPGFDPRGVRFYHQLYQEEAPKQARLNGAEMEVSERERVTPHVSRWSIKARWKNQSVTTAYEFMAWDDLVRRDWDASPWRLAWRALRYAVGATVSGGFRRIRQASLGAFRVALFPLVYLAGWLAVALLVFSRVAFLIAHAGGGQVLGQLTGFLLAVLIGGWAARRAEKLGIVWILRTSVFTYEWGRQHNPAVEKRMDEMAERIWAEQRTNPVDEVLLVGHCIGAIMAVGVAARLVRRAQQELIPQGIALLTLAHCIPYVSFHPGAQTLRRDLETLAQDDLIPWLDGTAAPDAMCFFRVDPVRSAGVKPWYAHRPRQFTVRLYQMFNPGAYAKLKRDRLRLHFQYLMASELPGDYDYFRLTAGPEELMAIKSR